MKKRLLVPVLFSLSLALTSCDDFLSKLSGNNTGQQTEVTLTGIEVTTLPNKVVYLVGERFDNTGMVVTAKYSDNSTKNIVTYTIDKNDPLTLEDTKVVVTYKDKTAEFPITVKEDDSQGGGFVETKSSDLTGIFVEEDGIDIYWGETYTLRYTYAPSDANNPEFNFRSNNSTILTVSNQGVITPTGNGEGLVDVIISHQNLDGTTVRATATFNVKKRILVTNLIPSITSAQVLKNGGTRALSVAYEPENATETELQYVFDNPSIAEMSTDNSQIVGKTPGRTTLTISTVYTGDTAEARVNVEVLDSNHVVLTVDENLSPTKYFSYQQMEQSMGTDVLLSKGDGTKPVKVAVCPVEFTDYPFSDKTLSDLEIAFNGTGENKTTGYWESVSSYFYKASHGKLDLQFVLLDKCEVGSTSTNGVSDSNYSYQIPSYMESCINNHIENHPEFNKKDFDYDHNGTYDSVWCIYSCPDYSQNSRFNDNYRAFVTATGRGTPNVNNPVIRRYGWASYDFMYNAYGSNTIDAHTYIHETGHLLGLNDYYNYDNSSSANEPIGCFDMQSYNVGGHNSWSKVALGWENPIIYDASKDTYAAVHLGKGNDGSCLFITNKYRGTAFDEFIVVELYTPDGLNTLDSSRQYPGRARMPQTYGVKMYHVDCRLVYAYTTTIGTATQQQTYIDYSSINRGLTYASMIAASNTSNYDRNYTNELFDQISLISRNTNGGAYMTRKTYSSANDFFKQGDVFTLEKYKKLNFYNNEPRLNNGSELNIKITYTSVDENGVDLLIEPI